jgi:Flp pilus assembly protein TadG
VRRSVVVSHRSGRGQGGSTVVEFALVFPLFFLLVAGAIEGGRFVASKMMLSYAVSVGARAATLSTATTNSVQNAVVNSAPMLHLSLSQVEITPAILPVAVNTDVTISIGVANASNKYQFTSLFPRYLSPFSSRGWSAQATMKAR